MTNENDKATQALDNLFLALANWMQCYDGGTSPAEMGIGLFRASREWEDASAPPGDPHKEWVDANKLKPNDVFQPVLVKTVSGKIGLATWTHERNFDGVKRSWQVQLFMKRWYWTKEGVTHWRYLPEMED